MPKHQNHTRRKSFNLTAVLWGVDSFLLLAMLFARAVYPEILWLSLLIGVLLIVGLGWLIYENQSAFKTRTAAYGVNSAVTVVLILALLGVINFLAIRYPFKADLTKNQLHTLSDQTLKAVKGLNRSVKATFFAKIQMREQKRSILENYKSLNPTKFELEFVDPDKETTRTRQAGIKKDGTLQLTVGPRESKVEEVTEEKITNALLKLLKEKSPQICALMGHGEKSFTSTEADGFDRVKKALSDQAYEVKEVNLALEHKIPDTCDMITLMGAGKSLLAPEVSQIKQYLDHGGRALIAVDLSLKGQEPSPEILEILQGWYVKPLQALVVDPISRLLGADASVALLASFQKEHSITKDFQANCLFPFTRPLEIMTGVPAEIKVQWLAQSTPKSWGVMDLAQLAKGQVTYNDKKDKMGPLNAAIVVEGKRKDSKASRNTRLVVFGTSLFANNNFSRLGNNLDFFVNSMSWLLEDESLISIRAKEEGPGKVELSQKGGTIILLLTVILIPVLISACGIVIWVIRRRK